MPISGHDSTVKVTGTPTAMVGEATTEVTTDLVFQITNAVKRILDPDAAVTVKIGGSATGLAHTIDYLFGIVTFAAPIGAADVVTIDANYLPTLSVLEAREFSIAMARDLADSTVFKSSPHRTRTALLRDASGSIGDLRALYDDLDPGGGTVKLFDLLNNGTRKVLEVVFGNSGYVFRAWILFEGADVNGPRDELVSTSLSWQLATNLTKTSAAYGIGLA